MSEKLTLPSGVQLEKTGEFTWKVISFGNEETPANWTEYFQTRMDRGQFKKK